MLTHTDNLQPALDVVGVFVFAVAGALKSLGAGPPSIAAIGIGGNTAVGGGALRDLNAPMPLRSRTRLR